MREELKQHLTASDTWLRGFYIVLFAIIYSLAEILVVAVVLFQFLATLVRGERNARLLDFGRDLSTYMYQILCYVTFNGDTRPYPFGEWPHGEPEPPATEKTTRPKSRAPKKHQALTRAHRRAPAKDEGKSSKPEEPPGE